MKSRKMAFKEVAPDEKIDRVDCCQYLLGTPINYTLTHFADHSQTFRHDQINRYLVKAWLTPRRVWEHVKPDLVQILDGCIIFDDTTLEKQHAKQIDLAKPQYSGNAGKVVNGIGVVTCVYVHPSLEAFLVWVYLMRRAAETGQTLYQVKHVLLSEYFSEQLKSPALKISAA